MSDFEQELNDMIIIAGDLVDSSRRWPNSYGHGWNTARYDTLIEIRDMLEGSPKRRSSITQPGNTT